MSLQTMALIKDDPELFESEFTLFVEENGVDSIENFVAQSHAEVETGINYPTVAADQVVFDNTEQVKTMAM